MRRLVVVYLCGLVMLSGCGGNGVAPPDQWERVLVRAPMLRAYTSSGVLAGQVELEIDPPAVLARVGDIITWTVSFSNGLVGEDVVMRASVWYTAPDETRQNLTTQATLQIDPTLLDITLRLYIPLLTGYVSGSLGAEELPSGGGAPVNLAPPEIWGTDDATGDIFLYVLHNSLSEGAVLRAMYSTEVGGTTTPPSGGATVSGTVIDATTGLGISGAAVAVAMSGVVTDSAGSYSIAGAPLGLQEIRASAVGYLPVPGSGEPLFVTVVGPVTAVGAIALVPEGQLPPL